MGAWAELSIAVANSTTGIVQAHGYHCVCQTTTHWNDTNLRTTIQNRAALHITFTSEFFNNSIMRTTTGPFFCLWIWKAVRLVTPLFLKYCLGTSLAVRWLGLCAVTAGAWVPCLAGELGPHACHTMQPKNKFLLKYSWFTMFPGYSKVIQFYIYIHTHIFSDSFPL